MKRYFKPVIASLFFASLLIMSALLLRGEEAGYWVDGVIYMSWVFYFYGENKLRKPCFKRSKGHA